MKRLFQINKPNGKPFAVGEHKDNVVYFSDKITAKVERNALNNRESSAKYTVAPGPDHHNYKG